MLRVCVLVCGLLALAQLPKSVFADLPVHCLWVEVKGDWVFYSDNGGQSNDITCGHQMPDRDDDHKDHEVRLSVDRPRVLNLQLKEGAGVVDTSTGSKGHWTMVYDEGFEVVINGYKYFAFSHYHSDPAKLGGSNVNDCDRTFVGWYHAMNGTDWGCYYGIKQGAVPLSKAPLKARKGKSMKDWANDVDLEHLNQDEAGDGSLPDKVEIPIHHDNPNTNNNNNNNNNKRGNNNSNISGNKKNNGDGNIRDFSSFLELINNSQSSFTVKYHDHLKNKSMNELRYFAGGFLQTQVTTAPLASRSRGGNFNISSFPRTWDWRTVDGQNYDTPMRYQGFCGSCYSMATVQMLESRLRIQSKNKHTFMLSTQDALSCSRYNQACDGGYPFLVSKYAQDFGIVTEECFPYSPGSDCDQRCKNPNVVVTTEEYYYVGGYYSACSEASMVQELVENGPFVISFNPGSDFMFYSGGIYSGSKYGDSFLEIDNDEPKMRVWEKTTHSVVLIGYGEDPSEGKYWIAKNTWGEQWGEHGYFRIRRGTDESAFESMGLAARPAIKHMSAGAAAATHTHNNNNNNNNNNYGGVVGGTTRYNNNYDNANNNNHEAASDSSSKWKNAALLQEGEGSYKDEESPAGNPQVKALESELQSYEDPDFDKSYPALRKPHGTNDYGVSLANNIHSLDDEDNSNESNDKGVNQVSDPAPNNHRKAQEQHDQQQHESHHSHHSHHHNHPDDDKSNTADDHQHHQHHHHHAHHHHSDDEHDNQKHSSSNNNNSNSEPSNNNIIEALQLDEGAGNDSPYADPADELGWK